MKVIQKDVQDAVLIDDIRVSAFTIPTDGPETDGTFAWNSTTMVMVEIDAGGKTGIGYTYSHVSAASVANTMLRGLIVGKDVMNIAALNMAMSNAVRNNGKSGVAMMAVSAVDIALWDLKAKILDLPLSHLLGTVRDKLLIYGSGGFTSYSNEQVAVQFEDWAAEGVRHFKMKIGTHFDKDVERVKAARNVVGKDASLFVDANGAYTVRQALEKAHKFEHYGVNWFEEPVPSHDLADLKFIRDHVPPSMNVVAGEYGYSLQYFKNMIQSEGVDILQGDATRCGGITGFLKAGYLCEAYNIPYSSHCAPAVHLHAALALPSFYIAEYFYDHARIEQMFFDHVPVPEGGVLQPDPHLPGLGLVLKEKDIKKYRV